MLMIRPFPLRRRWGRQRFVSRIAEIRSSSTAVSTSSSVISSAVVRGGPPLLLTRMSMPPNASSVLSTRRFRSFGFVTSPRTASAPRRSAWRASSSRRRANMATFAPSALSASAVARPIPADEPQTIAVRLLRPRSIAQHEKCDAHDHDYRKRATPSPERGILGPTLGAALLNGEEPPALASPALGANPSHGRRLLPTVRAVRPVSRLSFRHPQPPPRFDRIERKRTCGSRDCVDSVATAPVRR